MRYPTEGALNFFPGKRTLCHVFIASPYSVAIRFSVSKSLPCARARKNSSFFSCAFWANSSMFVIPFLRDVSIKVYTEQGVY